MKKIVRAILTAIAKLYQESTMNNIHKQEQKKIQELSPCGLADHVINQGAKQ